MHCPKCTGEPLETDVASTVEIDRCPKCRGIWLDALELETLLKKPPNLLLANDRLFLSNPGETGPRLACPRCEGTYLIKLNSRVRPGTILDSCTVCYGTWLDAGELSRLAGRELHEWLPEIFGG